MICIFSLVEQQRQQLQDLTDDADQILNSSGNKSTRKCTKCKAPMKGHPRGQCFTEKE